MDLLDSIDKLLPLLFLFIWVIVGLGAKGKKKAKSVPPSSTRKPAADQAPKPQPRSGGMGELKKTLQRVFEEIQAATAQPEIELPMEPEVVESARIKTPKKLSETANKGESEVSLETTSRRKLQPTSSPPTIRKYRQKIPLATVREGIIWSEILAPPVGMRE